MTIATKILSAVLIGFATTVAMISPSVALGADSAKMDTENFGDLGPAISELRQEAGKGRRSIVKANMLLTESEGKIFWPLYDEYRADREKLFDRRLQLITDFIAKRDGMSQDDAEHLTEESLKIDEDRISIKKRHIDKMHKVLSARTVARFFQIDGKLDTVVELALATRIPLIY
jgi:hypothetical protein